MSQPSEGAAAVIGNTRTVAVIAPDGAVTWLAMPTAGDAPVLWADAPAPLLPGAFVLRAMGQTGVQRELVGETAVLRSTYTTATGRANVMDFLPLRPGPGEEAKVPHDRLVRVIEVLEGEVAFEVRLAPRMGGAAGAQVVIDPNGTLFVGDRHTLLLQTEVALHRGMHDVHGEFSARAGESRHFVLTWVAGTDPDVPEMKVTEPSWDLDGTFDFWLAWTRRCPFRGVQRDYILRLAAHVRGAWTPPTDGGPPLDPAYGVAAPIALAAWGWESHLVPTLAAWPAIAATRWQGSCLAFDWLARAEQAGIIDGRAIAAAWPAWRALADDLATRDVGEVGARRLRAGLEGAARLADELLLAGDHAAWRARAEALGVQDAPAADDATYEAMLERGSLADAVAAIEVELDRGAYLQARRRLDRWLQAYDPVAAGRDELADAQALFLAARIYLVEPPTPGRVHLPGDLGE